MPTHVVTNQHNKRNVQIQIIRKKKVYPALPPSPSTFLFVFTLTNHWEMTSGTRVWAGTVELYSGTILNTSRHAKTGSFLLITVSCQNVRTYIL